VRVPAPRGWCASTVRRKPSRLTWV
jgi:hypothetical protein